MKQKELLELIVNLMENGMSSGKVINALEKDRHSHKYGEKSFHSLQFFCCTFRIVAGNHTFCALLCIELFAQIFI